MSIIYEALKKVERDQVAVSLPKAKAIEPEVIVKKTTSKSTKFLIFLLVAAIIAAFLSVAPKYLPQPVSLKSKKNVFASKQENFKRKVVPEKPITAAVTETKLPEVAPAPYVLQGIVYDEQLPSVIINGKTLRNSDKIDDFQVKEITPTAVKLVNLKDNTELNLSF